MENRLKERLTGAAILVALIVLIVPEMFHSQGRTAAAVRAIPSGEGAIPNGEGAVPNGEGPPVSSYTIDLDANGTAAVPMRLSAPPPGSQAAPVQASHAPASPTPAGPTPAGPASAGPASVSAPSANPLLARASAAGTAGITGSAGSTGSAASIGSKGRSRSAGRAAVAPRAAAAAPALAAAAGWSVQLGLFAKSANAARLVHAARDKGFSAHVSRSSRGLYRVALSGFSGRAAAQQAVSRLHAAGLPAAIVRPR